MNHIKNALTKLSTLAHTLNVEATSIKFETGCPDDEIVKHLDTSMSINSLTQAIWGYMQDDHDLLEKLEADRLEQLREHTDDLRNTNTMQERYKKRIKSLNNKLKRVSESQTKK